MKLLNNKLFILFFCTIFILISLQDMLVSKDIEFPLVQSFTYFPYSENNVLEKNEFGMGFDIYHSNIFTFNKSDNIMSDFELTSVTLGLRYGVLANITAELFFRYAAISGGAMDGFIEGFHSFFGLPEAYRPDYPRDIVNYFNNDYFDYEKNTGTMSPLIISLLARIYSDNSFSIKTRLGLGIPLKSKPGLSSDKLFLTAGLICSYRSENMKIDFSNYISWFKEPEWFANVELNDKIYFSEIRISYKRFLTGFIIKTSPLIESESGRNAYQIQLGYKINDNIELLFLEDFAPFDTSPDVSFNLRIKL